MPPMFAKIGIVGAILRNLKDVRADFFSKAIRIDPNPKATWQASAASARVVFILSASRTPPLMEEIKNGNDRGLFTN